MTLSKTRWIVRLFFWSVGILDAFTEGNRAYRIETRGTNLCFFFQTTFVWVPLILLLHLAVYGGLLSALIAAPIYFFGFGGYASVVGGILTLIALVAGVVALTKWFADRRYERLYKTDSAPDHGPSSAGIVWQWLVAQKQKVCPMISFAQGARV